jgi:hypothetical protein
LHEIVAYFSTAVSTEVKPQFRATFIMTNLANFEMVLCQGIMWLDIFRWLLALTVRWAWIHVRYKRALWKKLCPLRAVSKETFHGTPSCHLLSSTTLINHLALSTCPHRSHSYSANEWSVIVQSCVWIGSNQARNTFNVRCLIIRSKKFHLCILLFI